MTIREFVEEHKIRLRCVRIQANPFSEGNDPAWDRQASHWEINLTRKDLDSGRYRSMRTYFSMGSGHVGEPDCADVLNCAAMEAASYDDHGRFEEWAAEFGLNPDSRRAEQAWKAIGVASERLARFLGPDLYRKLLYKTERL